MSKFPFLGQSYVLRSTNLACQRVVNMYPFKSEVDTSKSEGMMQGTPGRSIFLTLPKSPIRGGINVNGRVFWVAADTFYEVFTDGTYVARGTLNSQSGTVGIDQNGLQVCVVDGPDGYTFTLLTNVFVQITDPYFLGADTVTFIDGYFAFNKPDSQIYYLSALYDGNTGDPLDFASAEGSPDNIVAVKAVHQQLWLFGQSTTQFQNNSGAADFPFQTIQGALIQYGCAAPYSVVQSANVVFWVGQDSEGKGMVWQANGYSPQRISTHAVEYALQQMSNISDCVAFAYQEDGHYFVQFNFPQAESSWVIDVASGEWHERAYWDNGAYSRDRANFHVYAYNKHLVGDYENGNIYVQSLNLYDDAGQPIRRMRTCPYISDDLNYIYFNTFQLDMQTGVGDDGGSLDDLLDPSTKPTIWLSWSNDGGHSWSNEYSVSMGRIGQYALRAIWRRMGRARQRVYKLVSTSNVRQFWINCYLQVEKGSN